MERTTKDSIDKRLSQGPINLIENNRLKVEQLVRGDSDQRFFFIDNVEQFGAVTTALGIDTVNSQTILGWQFLSTMDNFTELIRKDSVKLEGDIPLLELLSGIGDANMLGEFPNNYRINLALMLDNETTVLISEELDEQPHHCNECLETGQVEEDSTYGCGHGIDSVSISDSIVICGLLSEEQLEDFFIFG